MLSRRLVVGVYAILGAIGATVALVLGLDPLRTRALLPLSPPLLDAASAVAGLALAAIGVGSARILVARFAWAQRLHLELAAVVRGNSDFDLVIIALASGIGEEILFRGLATQLLGVILSSLLFGVLHQVRGPARWAWVAWATVMGLLLGGIYVATGSLLGPIIAHVVTNAVNLRFVRDHRAPPAPRPLGGLLRD
jgi:membrane protease YdiL (CAAX protease family)